MSHYRILGISKDASKAAIRSAYLRKVKVHHPDLSKSQTAAHQFQLVQEAYSVLYDDNKRKEYDLTHGFETRSSHPGRSDSPYSNSSINEEMAAFYKQMEQLRREKEARSQTFSKFRKGARRSAQDEPFSVNDHFRHMASTNIMIYLRLLPLIIFPSFILFIVYKQLKNVNQIRRQKPFIYYDNSGRAYVVDSTGRRHRMFEYDHIKANEL